MKRVKVMLMAIAVFAAVGGVVAFKASKGGSEICYNTSTSSGQKCALYVANSTVASPNPNDGHYEDVTGLGFTTNADCTDTDCDNAGIPNRAK